MRRAQAALLAALLAVASAAGAQTPRHVSPRLARALARDTTVLVWVVAAPGADLPALAADVTRLGGRVRHTSRFVGAVSAALPSRSIAAVARLRHVQRVQPVARFVRRDTAAPGHGGAGEPLERLVGPPVPRPPGAPQSAAADSVYGALAWVVDLLHVRELHARGLRGAGVRIALLDAGFDTQHPFMAGATIVAQHDFVYGDSVVRDQPGEAQGEMFHGTATWSLFAANAPGQLTGLAPEAEYLLAKTEFTPTETHTEEDNWVAAVEWADSLGADIIESSLGYRTFDDHTTYTDAQLNGDVAPTSIAADSAAARGILVIVSAGNDGPGPRTIGTPADADSALAIGAVDSLNRLASFSSRGPTGDGRIKPDVVAPGVRVPVAVSGGVAALNGTSFAAPLVAGLAAMVQGGRGAAPVLALLAGIPAAADSALRPDVNRGHGLPDARALAAWPGGIALTGGGDTMLAAVTPAFAWDPGTPPASLGPSLYRVRVAGDSALTQLVLDTTVLGTSLTLPRPLPPGTRLFYRVTGSNSDLGVAESTAVRGPRVVPAWVRLVTLASPAGSSIRDSLPTLVWSPAAIAPPAGPFTYDVDVYPAARGPSEPVASARGISDTTFTPPAALERSLPYRWRVVARTQAGDSAVVTSPGTFVVLDESVPVATVLFQNFPNPFPNPAVGLDRTCFWFDVAEPGLVELGVYDLRGRLIRRLTPSAAGGLPPLLPAGRYGRPSAGASGTCDPRFTWDGRDETGAAVRPGVYLYRLTAPRFRQTRHVVFLGAS